MNLQLQMLPRARLKFGHEHPDGDYNMRIIGREAERPDLRQSMREKGVLESFLGTTRLSDEGGDFVYLIVGNSRLKEGDVLADESPAQAIGEYPVLVAENLSRADAMELAEATERNKLPPHEVDRFEAYAPILAAGHSVEQVCAITGAAPIDVKRAMALAGMDADVRRAWRNGEIDKAAAQAFTLTPDLKLQKKLLKQLKASRGLNAYTIRNHLVPDQGDAQRLLEFVGIDAYRARGGAVLIDLFKGQHGVSDPVLAKQMADEKLEAECKRVVETDGWAWAEIEDRLPRDWRSWHQHHHNPKPDKAEQFKLSLLQAKFERDEHDLTDDERDEAEEAEGTFDRLLQQLVYRQFTAKERESSGCVLRLDDAGALRIEPGYVKPKEKPEARHAAGKVLEGDPAPLEDAPSGKDAKPVAEAEPVLPRSAVERLNVELTDAAARTLADDPDLAIILLLAGFAGQDDDYSQGGGGHGGAIRVRHAGLGSPGLKLLTASEIAINIGRLIAMKPAARLKLLAQAVAASLNFAASIADDDVAAIVDALDPKKLKANLDKTWDDEAFFNAAPKKLLAAIIEEACGAMAARDCGDLKKDELVKRAIANVTPSGWLPKELRSAAYSGPGAVKKPAKKKPAKTKKKGKR